MSVLPSTHTRGITRMWRFFVSAKGWLKLVKKESGVIVDDAQYVNTSNFSSEFLTHRLQWLGQPRNIIGW